MKLKVSTATLWRAAQSAEPHLWAMLESGQYDEETVDYLASNSLERAERRINLYE